MMTATDNLREKGVSSVRGPKSALRSGASWIAILAAGLVLADPAHAGCSDNNPANGETVTCTASAPNPDENGVGDDPGPSDVTVDIQAGAEVGNGNLGGREAIFLGGGATITSAPGSVINGGIRIVGGEADIITAGRIDGNDGIAIWFAEGFINRLELRAGYDIRGNVIGDSTFANDLLVLGGSADADFDVGQINTQYFNFGRMEKRGSSTWRLTGTNNNFNAFFGVYEGAIFLFGAEFGDTSTSFYNGTTLAGTGRLGRLEILDGAVLDPGSNVNPLGIIETGDLLLASDSILNFDVQEDGDSDLIIVNGTVSLEGGTLNIVEAGDFMSQDAYNYTIIQNDLDDAVDGTFGTITNQLAFLTPIVNYSGGDGNDVTLVLTEITSEGQCSVPAGNGVDTVCAGIVSNSNPPNGYGTGSEADVTILAAEDA